MTAAADMDSNADAADMYARADALGVRGRCTHEGQCQKRRDQCFHWTLSIVERNGP